MTPGSRILLNKNLCSARFAHQGDRERVPLEGPAEGAGGDGGLVAQVVAGEGSDQGEGAEGGLGGVGGPGLRALQGGWSWQSYGIAKVQTSKYSGEVFVAKISPAWFSGLSLQDLGASITEWSPIWSSSSHLSILLFRCTSLPSFIIFNNNANTLQQHHQNCPTGRPFDLDDGVACFRFGLACSASTCQRLQDQGEKDAIRRDEALK